MGNGVLVSHTTTAHDRDWRWRETVPMATYLATVTNGVFETRFDRPGGPGATTPSTRSRAVRGRTAGPGARPGTACRSSRRWSASSATSTGPTRSRASAGSSTGRRTSATLSSPRRSRTTGASRRRRDRRPRARPPVVRRLGLAREVAGHLAERGLRDLVGVDLVERHGGATAQVLFDDLYATPEDSRRRPGPLVPGPGGAARTRRSCSRRRSTTAAR